MNIKSGSFTKNAAAEDNTKTAIIHMTDGKLIADGSVDGSGKKSIQMMCGGENVSLKNVFGVYSEGGTVSLQDVQIVVNGTYSAGVLAITGEQAASEKAYAVTVADSVIDVKFREDKLSSSGISTEGGNIQLKGSVLVTSQGLGITARMGSIDIAAGGESEVDTPRGTGVYVNNGKLTVEASAALSVKSTVLGNEWVNPPEVSGGVITTHNDGVVVEGGSLEANGTLNVTLQDGIENSYTSNRYDGLVINSFAVRVLSADKVTIASGNIESAKGGGVYVGGGAVTLGNGSTGPTVQTKGTGYGSDWYDQDGDSADGTDAWHFHKNTTGGHAVEVVGGNLTIHGGNYSALMGNGIQVNNQATDSVTINGGTFSGADAYKPGTTASAALAGPGASYAFKMYGGSVTINGGTFGNPDSLGGGAFVTGSGSRAEAKIYAGTFDVGGTAAFTVYQNADLFFGKQSDADNTKLQLKGESAGLTVEKLDGGAASSIKIYSGTFSGGNHTKTSGGCDGIYYNGSGQTTLEITGGDFIGRADSVNYGRSGLYFEVAPNENNVQLSGGTYYGSKNDLYAELRWGGNTIQTFGNHTQNNAIAGNASFDNILADSVAAYGDTQFDTSSIVSGLENFSYSYTDETVAGGTEQVLSGINSKAKAQIEYRFVIAYHEETDLVYSKITIR